MVPLIAIGAVGVLVWTGYKAYRKEADRLERKDALDEKSNASAPSLERDPETGRYKLPKR